MLKNTLCTAVASTALVAFAVPAAAQVFTVAPDGFADTDGDLILDGPIDDPGDRFQQVYSSDFFDSAQTITQIQFRAANPENAFRPNSITASDITITLSTTSNAATGAGIAGSFDSNVGSDVQVVYSGPITLDRGGSNPSGPQPFQYGFTLQMPFDYDPSMGNLLLDVSVPDSATVTNGPGFGALESFDGVVDQPDTDGVASKTGNAGARSSGLVTQFTSTAIPEPTSLALLGIGGLVALRRRR